jgi:hypothetical protein
VAMDLLLERAAADSREAAYERAYEPEDDFTATMRLLLGPRRDDEGSWKYQEVPVLRMCPGNGGKVLLVRVGCMGDAWKLTGRCLEAAWQLHRMHLPGITCCTTPRPSLTDPICCQVMLNCPKGKRLVEGREEDATTIADAWRVAGAIVARGMFSWLPGGGPDDPDGRPGISPFGVVCGNSTPGTENEVGGLWMCIRI